MVAEGRLEVDRRADHLGARETADGLEVEYRRRGGAQLADRSTFAYAFNCTGPLHSIARTKDPLLRSLLDAAQVQPDHLGIGLEVDEHVARRTSICGRSGR